MLMKTKTNRFKTIAIVTMVVLMLIFQVVGSIGNAASTEETLKTAKHVAVVYDDSGSMYHSSSWVPHTKWSHANYMIQAFCALLNPEDSLFVTYMSNSNVFNKTNYIDGDRDESIETLSNWTGMIRSTPYEAITTAAEGLLTLEESNEDEYWLVVLTDGVFSSYDGDLNEDLEYWTDKFAKEGKTLKIAFFGIGLDTTVPDVNEEKGLLSYSTDDEGIVETMSDIAHTISARQPTEFTIDGKTVTANIELPVYELVSFSQGGGVLKSAQDSDGNELSIISSFDINAPESFTLSNSVVTKTDETLTGNIAHIESSDGQPLQPGDYTLTYDSDVQDTGIKILYEPAISLRLQWYVGGTKVDIPQPGTYADVKAEVINISTGEPLDEELFEGSISCTLTEMRNGEVKRSVEGFELENIDMITDVTSILWDAEIDGYFSIRGRMNYDLEKLATAVPTPEPSASPIPEMVKGFEIEGNFPPDVSMMISGVSEGIIPLSDIEDSQQILILIKYNDGLTNEKIEEFSEITLTTNAQIDYSLEWNPGLKSYEVVLAPYNGSISATSTGRTTFNVTYISPFDDEIKQSFSVTIGELPWYIKYYSQLIIPVIAFIVVILLLGIWVLKRRFSKGAILIYRQMKDDEKGKMIDITAPARIDLNKIKNKYTYIPFASERLLIAGLVVYPGMNSHSLRIPKQYLKNNMGTRVRKLSPDAMERTYILNNNIDFVIDRGESKEVIRLMVPKKSIIKDRMKRRSK